MLASFVAIQAFYAGAQRLGAAHAAIVSTVEPIWTISLAALVLGERLAPIQLLGGALIIAAVLLAQATDPRAASREGPRDATPVRERPRLDAAPEDARP